jgi:hypothetical protein
VAGAWTVISAWASPLGIRSGYDVLSDTMGVDFDYLARVVHDVRQLDRPHPRGGAPR